MIVRSKYKLLNRVVFIFTLFLFVFLLSLSCFADSSWYTPNETLSSLTSSPNGSAYWIDVEYELDGQTYSYSTQGASGILDNIHLIDDGWYNFGSTDRDIVTYKYGVWKIRFAGGDTIRELSNTDIKVKLHVIDETEIVDFVSWFHQ